ncbi:MAG: hypothetical protein DMG58_26180 [Acidobacteria bacterium]|nr:MAG: hypothetical protein DMG58_26180 [Acidobacteriota bacterium]
MIVTPLTGIRKTSSLRIGNLPLLSIAMGPDPAKGEIRGHAKGVIAIGDMATGWVALGGLARGGVALGGLSVGVVAWGGAAVGYYACGGAAFGQYVMSAATQDPEAVELFGRFLPWLRR